MDADLIAVQRRTLRVLASAQVLGGAPTGAVAILGAGLFLLDLGWSGALAAGSTLLSESVAEDVRPRVQGVADFAMGVARAVGGAVSGLVLGLGGFAR